MLTDDQIGLLESAWAPARAQGALGGASVAELRDHAVGFAPAASVVLSSERVLEAVDVGSGVGVPGVLLAVEVPNSRWRLVDASERRCDHARRAVAALGLEDRVTVVHGRAEEVAHESPWRGRADLVVARLFGSPADLAECGVPLLADDGRLVVSTSESVRREWDAVDLSALSATIDDEWLTSSGRFLSVRRVGPVDERFPRRTAHRRRHPLRIDGPRST